MTALKVENISYTYMKKTPFEKKALDNVSFQIEAGTFTGIIGHTGCGKSTLIQHFNGLLRPDSGKIYINGKLTEGSDVKEMRKKVGLVFQYPEYQLFESTVYRDIAFGLRGEKLTEEEERRRVEDAARKTGLTHDTLDRSVYELSGGQKRRVAIAGITVMNPDILVLDEPAAGLDPEGRKEILKLTKDLCDKNGVTVILVSHSMEDIAELADNIIVMNDGGVELTGTPREIFTNVKRLREICLDVPLMTDVFSRLAERFPEAGIRRDILTVEEAACEVLRVIDKGTACGQAAEAEK